MSAQYGQMYAGFPGGPDPARQQVTNPAFPYAYSGMPSAPGNINDQFYYNIPPPVIPYLD